MNQSDSQDLTASQLDILRTASASSALLSTVGCVFILIAPLCLMKRTSNGSSHARTISDDHVDQIQHILLWLSVSDLILSLSFLFNWSNQDATLCQVQGGLL